MISENKLLRNGERSTISRKTNCREKLPLELANAKLLMNDGKLKKYYPLIDVHLAIRHIRLFRGQLLARNGKEIPTIEGVIALQIF